MDATNLDPAELKKTKITHVAHAIHTKNLDYIEWLILRQVEAGANIIDVCVDEISVYPDERHECMRWIIPVVQKMTDEIIAIDSSDSQTLAAGLESP